MRFYKKFIRPLYLSRRTYFVLGFLALIMVAAFGMPFLLVPAQLCVGFLGILVLLDYLLLFVKSTPVTVKRVLPERFSNGDPNPVSWILFNHTTFPIHTRLLDEMPVQLAQLRKWTARVLQPGKEVLLEEEVRPVERGIYVFNSIILLLKSPLGLVVRRVEAGVPEEVKVYPSYLEIRKYSLLAFSDARSETGNRAIRRIGHSMEFEQIKEYVLGDDVRAVNWKATARRGQLMVNHYTDERAQQVYCVIDKSRVMKMSFAGLTLLDYAINASLMLLRVALLKQDKAGLLTFSDKIDTLLPAERRGGQMGLVLETLYKEKTGFREADYERLYATVKRNIPQRSLLVLFTNFESRASLERQLPYLQSMASRHLLLVVFFENPELEGMASMEDGSVEALYKQTIARQFIQEKRWMVKELQRKGILSVLCAPEAVTIQTVNKYLELKGRMLI